MKHFRDCSISTKIRLLVLVTAGLGLLMACAVFVVNDQRSARQSMTEHLKTLSDVMGANSVAAITFDDQGAGTEILSSLRKEPTVRRACLYSPDGELFAVYHNESDSEKQTQFPVPGDGVAYSETGSLRLFTEISDSDETIGSLFVEAGMEHLYATTRKNVMSAVVVLLVALSISIVLTDRLQKGVSVPIVTLADAAVRITEQGDYSLRVAQDSRDEVGVLFQKFNDMLQEIETRQEMLNDANSNLQAQSRELASANAELKSEITERIRAEEELVALQGRFVDTARKAGMAEIATSVLHNVGNVLNSVTVSTGVICEQVGNLGVSDLDQAAKLIEEHLDGFGTFVTEHAQGKHLPQFMIAAAQHAASTEETILEELHLLQKNIDHIREIVAVQQTHAGFFGLEEEVSVAQLLNDAIGIVLTSEEYQHVDVNREYDDLPPVVLEKQRFLQIVINLISNAKHAVLERDGDDKRLSIRLTCREENVLQVEVDDNGVGIPTEKLQSIFAHGYTTRNDGHGFGLHSAALAAQELGGALTARSEGPGTGATFTLEIPIKISRGTSCKTETICQTV